jgi:hypothetical protein
MGKSKIIRETEEKKQGTMPEYRNRRQRTLQGGEAGTPHSQFPMQQNEHAIYSWSYVCCEAGRLGLKYTSKREETSIPPMLSADKPSIV